MIDASTGQNGLVQAKQFAEAVDVTGIVLTKLDGTAKGGIVLAIRMGAGLPFLAAAYLLSEAIETVVLFVLARRHLGLAVRVDARATKAVVLLCLLVIPMMIYQHMQSRAIERGT